MSAFDPIRTLAPRVGAVSASGPGARITFKIKLRAATFMEEAWQSVLPLGIFLGFSSIDLGYNFLRIAMFSGCCLLYVFKTPMFLSRFDISFGFRLALTLEPFHRLRYADPQPTGERRV